MTQEEKIKEIVENLCGQWDNLEYTGTEDGKHVIKRGDEGHAYIDVESGDVASQIPTLKKAAEKAIIEGLAPPEVEDVDLRPKTTPVGPAAAQPANSGPLTRFRPAERKKAKLRLALTGPAGSGKTASALLIARGLVSGWERIGLVDTEAGSGELYVGSKMGDEQIKTYNVLPLPAPYTPQRYIDAIKMAEAAGLDVVILDSLSHAWEGEGGILELHDTATMASKSKNSYFAWKEITPLHRALIETILTSEIHIIATMRTKTEYVVGSTNGKATPTKVGTAPIQRAGTDYEFTTVLDLSTDHIATATKDRTNLFDGEHFIPTTETGSRLLQWLEVD